MNILFVSSACSESMREKILAIKPSKYGIQGQKFMNMLLQGLACKREINLTVISKYSNRNFLNNSLYLPYYSENENLIRYNYLPEHKILKNTVPFIANLIYVINWCRFTTDRKIICDGLSFNLLISTLIAAKLTNTHVCTFVTDLPRFLVPKSHGKLKSLIFKTALRGLEYFISKSNSFIFLAEPFNELLNKNLKPSIIVEGIVPSKSETVDFKTIPMKTCIYAGTIDEKYGIKKLVSAFQMLTHLDYELHIYGGGDFEVQLKEICASAKNIKYFGWISNDEILTCQKNSSLLINPRPSDEEFTKYSFPSKTLEYMLSGTPVVTTILPSIPQDYYDCLYFFEDESITGIANKIEKILNLPLADRKAKALKAYQFVSVNKNEKIQANRVFSFLSKINDFKHFKSNIYV